MCGFISWGLVKDCVSCRAGGPRPEMQMHCLYGASSTASFCINTPICIKGLLLCGVYFCLHLFLFPV